MWKRSSIPYLQGNHPLVMAHRGDSANIPENTLQAYQDAYDLKVDVIETDLRITKDEQIIFFHDKKVNRTTNGKGLVISHTLADLKKLDQGHWFEGKEKDEGKFPFRGKGFQIQSLEEILTRFPNIRFNMDIKDKDPRAPKLLAKKLKELDSEERVMVGSFHHKQLKRFRELSSVPTSASPVEVWAFRQKVNRWIKKHPDLNDNFSTKKDMEQKDFFGKPLPYFALQIPEKVGFLPVFKGSEFFSASCVRHNTVGTKVVASFHYGDIGACFAVSVDLMGWLFMPFRAHLGHDDFFVRLDV